MFHSGGSGLTQKHYSMLERPARDQYSSLLQIFVIYSRKILYNIGPWIQFHKESLELIY